MNIEHTPLQGLLIIEPVIFKDARGYFFESYNQQKLNEAVSGLHFVQDNQSLSQKGVLRGLHFQHPPFAQGKLVRVIKGSVFDVAVDIRKTSATYGQWFGLELSEINAKMLYVPPGFAHGFLTLEHNTIFSYKCTSYYNANSEDAIMWNDMVLKIDWPVTETVLVSDKDQRAKSFKTFNSPF